MKKRSLFWLGLGALTAYVGLPYLLAQVGNLGLLRRGRTAGTQLALTFDDGPDPETTPRVLEALREANVRATFFVLGKKALAHPDLVRQLVAEGHEVAAHGLSHRHAWARLPWSVGRDLAHALKVLREITGRDVRFFRPPHGAYTLATLLALRSANVEGAHWTVEAHDWHPDFTPERVKGRVLSHVRPGSVIVMHDAGPGAANTMKALPELLRELKARGYEIVPLGELPDLRSEQPRDLVARGMAAFDRVYARAGDISPVGSTASSLLKAGLAPFPVEGHPEFARGETFIEVHIDSERLVLAAPRPLHTIRLVRQGMRELARELEARPEWREARGVFGAGPFGEVLSSLGFEIRDLPAPTRRRLTRWATFLHWAYSGEKLHSVKGREAKLGFLTREEFLGKYGLSKHGQKPRGA